MVLHFGSQAGAASCCLLRRMSPVLAQSGHPEMSAYLSAFGGTADIRQSRRLHWSDAIDPKRSSGGAKSRSAAVSVAFCVISYEVIE
jgi:hypothetical protein